MRRFRQTHLQQGEREHVWTRTAVVVALTVLLLFLLIAPAGNAGTYNGAATLAQSGRVVGKVTCAEEPHTAATQGEEDGHDTHKYGLAGMKIWLLGTSFTAVTDEEGRFAIDYVPNGAYRLAVVTTGMKIRAIVDVAVPKQAELLVPDIAVTGGCGGCSGEGGGGHETGDLQP